MRDRQETWRAVVSPVSQESRPTWSVMIPAYDRIGYLRDSLGSVLAQDPGPEAMQIEVVDDCSTEPVADLVAELGGGRVELFRQPANVGNARNFSTCVQRARGELVHLLHSDDAVLPGFYEALAAAFARHPELGAAFCSYLPMTADGRRHAPVARLQEQAGILPNWLERIAGGQKLQTPCMVVRRAVYERLGGFDERIRYGEDWEMWVRVAARYPVWYEPRALAAYRVHPESISGRTHRTGADVADLRRVIESNRELLPAGREPAITRRVSRVTAVTALRRGARAFGHGDRETARAQAREAFRTSRAPTVFAHALYYYGRIACYLALRPIVRPLRRRVSP
jgi:GT2 family glycosyltransferase